MVRSFLKITYAANILTIVLCSPQESISVVFSDRTIESWLERDGAKLVRLIELLSHAQPKGKYSRYLQMKRLHIEGASTSSIVGWEENDEPRRRRSYPGPQKIATLKGALLSSANLTSLHMVENVADHHLPNSW